MFWFECCFFWSLCGALGTAWGSGPEQHGRAVNDNVDMTKKGGGSLQHMAFEGV